MLRRSFWKGLMAWVGAVGLVACTQNPASVVLEFPDRQSPSRGSQTSAEQVVSAQAAEVRPLEVGPSDVQSPDVQSPNSKTNASLGSISESIFGSKTPKTNPAVLALMDRADASGRNGDYPSAEISLERALRIEPKNLKVYRLMAELKLQKGEPQAALEIVRKGLAAAKGNTQREEKRRLQHLLTALSSQ